MNEYLRLDMYINGKEFLICEAAVSAAGFEECLNANDVVNSQIAAELRSTGGSAMSADMLTEQMLDVLYDISDREITAGDEVTFCMCLWNSDEHIRSLVSLNSL